MDGGTRYQPSPRLAHTLAECPPEMRMLKVMEVHRGPDACVERRLVKTSIRVRLPAQRGAPMAGPARSGAGSERHRVGHSSIGGNAISRLMLVPVRLRGIALNQTA